MPTTGPFSRVSTLLERRHRDQRRPIDGTSIRLAALFVFLALVVLMVLAASPSMAATAESDPATWERMINLAPILFWVAVAVGVVVRIVLGRRRARPVDRPAPSPGRRSGTSHERASAA